MTKREFKAAWSSVDISAGPWWSWPLGLLMAVIFVLSCALGYHSFENLRGGPRCLWCGKEDKR